MSDMYRDRAYCTRSQPKTFVGAGCSATTCDRYVDATVIRLADKAGLPIGWADLMTSKCGYKPLGGEN